MPNVAADELTAFAIAVYEAAGTPPEHARIVAAHQVGANLAGHDSHGVVLLPTYVDRIDRGHIVPTARPEIVNESPASLAVNGGWGFGPDISEWTTRDLEALIAPPTLAHLLRAGPCPEGEGREGLRLEGIILEPYAEAGGDAAEEAFERRGGADGQDGSIVEARGPQRLHVGTAHGARSAGGFRAEAGDLPIAPRDTVRR